MWPKEPPNWGLILQWVGVVILITIVTIILVMVVVAAIQTMKKG